MVWTTAEQAGLQDTPELSMGLLEVLEFIA